MRTTIPAPAPANRWRYGGPALALHWTMAVLLVMLLGLGWYMMSIEDDPGSDWYFDLHKSFGLLLFPLFLTRLAWRLSHPPPPLPATVSRLKVRFARVTHLALYACMLLMPLTGFLGASFSKAGVKFFGAQVPAPAFPDHNIAEIFFALHSALAWVIVALVVLHAAAGLKHLLLDRDGVFQRMWP